jgi:hypothetical protein
VGVPSLLLAGCGSEPAQEPAPAERSVAMAPAISPSAAPGVAFSYRYDFVLPDQSISRVQEQHASACEKLGPARCRIVGLSYRLIDEGRVEGALHFKLAPDLAREFGKQGIAAIEKADGKLVDAEITGDDAGTRIATSETNSSDISAEIQRIEQALVSGQPGTEEAATLRRRLEELRAQLLQEKQSRIANQELLSNTPMTFTYTGDAGFSLEHNPVSDAIHAAWASIVALLTVVLVGLGYAVPWLVLAAVLLALWRTRPVLWVRAWVRGRGKPEGMS